MELDSNPGTVVVQSEENGIKQFKNWLGKAKGTMLNMK